MKVKTIEYSHSYESYNPATGLKSWVKAGMSAEIDDHESPEFQLHNLKKMVEDFHKGNKPAFLTDAAPIEWSVPINPAMDTPIKSIDRKAIERLEILIDNAVNIDELSKYREDAIKYGIGTQFAIKAAQLLSPKQ